MRHFFQHRRMFPTLLTRLGTLYLYGAQMEPWLCGCKLDSGDASHRSHCHTSFRQRSLMQWILFFFLKNQRLRSKSKLWALPVRLRMCVKLKGIASLPLPLPNKRPTNPDSLTQKQSVKPAEGDWKWNECCGGSWHMNTPPKHSRHLTLKPNHPVSMGAEEGFSFAKLNPTKYIFNK